MLIKEDNQGVIKIATGEVKHKHQKHILLRLSFVRESVRRCNRARANMANGGRCIHRLRRPPRVPFLSVDILVRELPGREFDLT